MVWLVPVETPAMIVGLVFVPLVGLAPRLVDDDQELVWPYLAFERRTTIHVGVELRQLVFLARVIPFLAIAASLYPHVRKVSHVAPPLDGGSQIPVRATEVFDSIPGRRGSSSSIHETSNPMEYVVCFAHARHIWKEFQVLGE